MMNYIEAINLGFEVFAELPTYSDALVEMFAVMEENHSNCVCICEGDSGESPFKLMVIPNSKYLK